MAKDKLTVSFIEMYCKMVREKFGDKLNVLSARQYEDKRKFEQKMEKKYGADKLRKQYNALGEQLTEIRYRIQADYAKVDPCKKLENEIKEIQDKIRMATCPEDIKAIFDKIKI